MKAANRILSFIVLALAAGPSLAYQAYGRIEGRVVGVTDGDTATVLDARNQQIEVRLFAIDAPETTCHARTPTARDESCVDRGQEFGKAAKKALSGLIFGKTVRVDVMSKDRSYGRVIGFIFVGNTNANLAMVEQGYAWVYRDYARRSLNAAELAIFDRAQENASRARLGLWSSNYRPTPPWEYRHSHQRSAGL